MTEKLLIRDRGPIREIRLSRPEVHNAFDEELIAALTTAFVGVAGELDAGRDLRAVLLSGAGRSFCAGADLHYMSSIAAYGGEENRRDAARLSAMFLAIRATPVPVVARIQGAALGGGAGLVAAADLAIAEAGARFGFTEVRLGIVPAVISPFVLERIGAARARALFPTGERFEAGEALRIGLVDRVAPEGALDAAVDEVLRHLLEVGPVAARETKQLVARVATQLPLPLDPGAPLFAETAAWIARLRGSPEGREGMAAFLEKRAPSWKQELPPEADPEAKR